MHDNLAAAERLRDRGLLADALYVQALLAQLRGQWDEARAQSDRGLALAAGHLPLLHVRAVLEYETGNDVGGGQYVPRLIDADRDAKPYPLAGIFTAVALSQIAYITNGMPDTESAIDECAFRDLDARDAFPRRADVTAAMKAPRRLRASRPHAALLVEGQLLAQEQVLRHQLRARRHRKMAKGANIAQQAHRGGP